MVADIAVTIPFDIEAIHIQTLNMAVGIVCIGHEEPTTLANIAYVIGKGDRAGRNPTIMIRLQTDFMIADQRTVDIHIPADEAKVVRPQGNTGIHREAFEYLKLYAVCLRVEIGSEHLVICDADLAVVVILQLVEIIHQDAELGVIWRVCSKEDFCVVFRVLNFKSDLIVVEEETGGIVPLGMQIGPVVQGHVTVVANCHGINVAIAVEKHKLSVDSKLMTMQSAVDGKRFTGRDDEIRAPEIDIHVLRNRNAVLQCKVIQI